MKIPKLHAPRAFQFRLGTLLVAIFWVAIVCMGLRTANEPWSGMLFIFSTGSMLLAALMSIYRTGSTRAFALGFLIFGGWYVFLSSGDHNYDDPSTARPDLITTRGAIALYSLVHGDGVQTSALTFTAPAGTPYAAPRIVVPAATYQVVSETAAILPSAGMTIPPPPTGPSISIPPTPLPPQPVVSPVPMSVFTRTIRSQAISLSTFLSVAHNSLLMLLGLIGGITAQWLHATRRDEPTVPRGAKRLSDLPDCC